MKPFTKLLAPILLALPILANGAHAGTPTEPAPPLMGWTFDEGSGSVTIDRFSTLTGTLEGFGVAPWPSPGPFGAESGTYLAFSSSGSRVVVRDTGVVAARPSSSVSAWFKFSTMPEPRQHVLYSERNACGFNVFWVGIDLRPGVPPGLAFGVYDTTSSACAAGTWHVLTHPVVPTDGAWHHVVATLEPAGGLKLFYDGALVGTLPGVPPFLGGLQGESTIGHAHTPETPTYWRGSIDEVGIFDHALSPGEVAWLFAHSLGGIATPAHQVLCFGDGSGTACPCGNESPAGANSGCQNSSGTSGSRLTAMGSARVSFDTLTLTAVEMPPGTSCLFFQGTTAINGGAGAVFGDGLRCAGGSILRLEAHAASDHFDWYPHAGEPVVSVKGALPALGGERIYQVWYRNAATYCTSAMFNLTNAVRVVWTP